MPSAYSKAKYSFCIKESASSASFCSIIVPPIFPAVYGLRSQQQCLALRPLPQGAGVVPADTSPKGLRVFSQLRHNGIGRKTALTEPGCFFQWPFGVGEKPAQSGAQDIEPRLPFSADITGPSGTHRCRKASHGTGAALPRQAVFFVAAEAALSGELDQRPQVSMSPMSPRRCSGVTKWSQE